MKEVAIGLLIGSNQISKGFSRLAEALGDLSLDIPSIKALFDKLVSITISQGWFDASFSKYAALANEMQNTNVEKVKSFKEESSYIIHEYFYLMTSQNLFEDLKSFLLQNSIPFYSQTLSHLLWTERVERNIWSL